MQIVTILPILLFLSTIVGVQEVVEDTAPEVSDAWDVIKGENRPDEKPSSRF